MKTYLPEITLKYKNSAQKKVKIIDSDAAAKLLKKLHDPDTIELFETVIVLFLNSNNTTIGWVKHSNGGSVSCIVDVRLIMSTALKCGASRIILCHNHVTGNLTASKLDIQASKALSKACKVLGMKLVDSIIITANSEYTSLEEEGLI